MKIEKLNKENINEFIKSMNLDDDTLVSDINKREYYGVKDDANYLIGFVIEPEDDVITIKYDNAKVNSDSYLSIIKFLKENMVVKNHLIIKVFNSKRMKVLDEVFKCREVHLVLKNCDEEVASGVLKEKYADIDMMSIRYNMSKEEIVCNLVRQNIQSEDVICKLHEFFMSLDIGMVEFVVTMDNYDYLTSLGYKCDCKYYVL